MSCSPGEPGAVRELRGVDALGGDGTEPVHRLRQASEIVKTAAASGRSLREVALEAGVEESVLDEALDYHAMARPHG